MNIMHHLVIIATIWVILLFISLPLFITRDHNPKIGHSTGAPKTHYLSLKLILTLILSVIIAFIYTYYFGI